MPKIVSQLLVLAALLFCVTAPAGAQSVEPSDGLRQRAAQLTEIVNGGGDVEDMFAPSFLAQVPEAQLRALFAQVVEQQGQAGAASNFTMVTPDQGQFDLAFDKAIGEIRMTVATR